MTTNLVKIVGSKVGKVVEVARVVKVKFILRLNFRSAIDYILYNSLQLLQK